MSSLTLGNSKDSAPLKDKKRPHFFQIQFQTSAKSKWCHFITATEFMCYTSHLWKGRWNTDVTECSQDSGSVYLHPSSNKPSDKRNQWEALKAFILDKHLSYSLAISSTGNYSFYNLLLMIRWQSTSSENSLTQHKVTCNKNKTNKKNSV